MFSLESEWCLNELSDYAGPIDSVKNIWRQKWFTNIWA